jgi:hypothetical protein
VTEIGYVIQPGEDIPEDVISVDDRARDGWALGDDDWVLVKYKGEVVVDHAPGLFPDFLSRRWGPLTVTAVREPGPAAEPQPDPVHYHADGADYTACRLDPWTEPEEENPDNWVHSTAEPGKVTCGECRATLTALKPQPADGSAPDGWYVANGVQAPIADLMAQVMAELGVDRPEDVLPALAAEREATKDVHEAMMRILAQRDEARSDLEESRGQARAMAATAERFHAAILVREQERDEARAEVERLKVLSDEDVERATLVGLIKEALRVSTGGEILPAIDKLIATQPDPLVLSLPEVPEGAVALVGGNTGRRYERRIARPDEDVMWADPTRTVLLRSFSEILGYEGSVRVEMAPPRKPRTAQDNVDELRNWLNLAAEQKHWEYDEAIYCLDRIEDALSKVLDEPDGAR